MDKNSKVIALSTCCLSFFHATCYGETQIDLVKSKSTSKCIKCKTTKAQTIFIQREEIDNYFVENFCKLAEEFKTQILDKYMQDKDYFKSMNEFVFGIHEKIDAATAKHFPSRYKREAPEEAGPSGDWWKKARVPVITIDDSDESSEQSTSSPTTTSSSTNTSRSTEGKKTTPASSASSSSSRED